MLGLITSLFLLASAVAAGSNQYDGCQRVKPWPTSQLQGCLDGTIYVSQNDTEAKFTSVQAAVESLPNDDSSAVILIGPGRYQGLVNVTRTGPVTLLGQYVFPGQNLVMVWNNQFVTEPPPAQDDAQTAVLIVAPTFNASLIGMGPTGFPLQPQFGNADFKAYHVDFANLAAGYAISQALVTDISYANASFYGCNFASYQDTWYTGRNASTYVKGGTVYGSVDYVFGFGTAWFEEVAFAFRAPGGCLTAWKGTNRSDPTDTTPIAPGNHYGVYVSNSQIIRSPDANSTLDFTSGVYLGRPWNDLATAVFLNTYMGDLVNSTGFIPFGGGRNTIFNTTYYAEYNSYGPGGNTTGRASDHILNAKQSDNFTIPTVFGDWPGWIDYDY